MAKHKYTNEYELNAAVKMVYPYLSTAAGLKEWFAEDVQVIDDKNLDIVWDGTNHPAQIVSWRTNSHIKYRFAPEEEGMKPSTLEFKVEFSEMTQTTFIRIVDYSDMEDEDELDDLWDNLIDALKEKLGDAS